MVLRFPLTPEERAQYQRVLDMFENSSGLILFPEKLLPKVKEHLELDGYKFSEQATKTLIIKR